MCARLTACREQCTKATVSVSGEAIKTSQAAPLAFLTCTALSCRSFSLPSRMWRACSQTPRRVWAPPRTSAAALASIRLALSTAWGLRKVIRDQEKRVRFQQSKFCQELLYSCMLILLRANKRKSQRDSAHEVCCELQTMVRGHMSRGVAGRPVAAGAGVRTRVLARGGNTRAARADVAARKQRRNGERVVVWRHPPA